MRKLLIINPPRFNGQNVRRDERSADILESEVSPFYQGAVLAQFIRNNSNFEVDVLDANGLDWSYEQLKDWVGKRNDALVAVIKGADDTLLFDAKAAEICKEFDITTIFWEPILSPAEPKKVLEILNKDKKVIDYLILGEAEVTVSDFLLKGKNAKGLAFFDDNYNFVLNKRSNDERLKNLEDLPIPDFNDLPVKNYKAWFGEGPWMTLFTSRGCPGNCSYCLIGGSTVFRGYGSKIRMMSAERIVQEVEILINDFDIKHVTFWDDCFTLDRNRVEEFCNIIISKKIKFKWSCMSRVDTVDKDLIELMKKAGLKRIGFGIESASQKILDSIPKKVKAEDNYNAMKIAKEAGIWTWIYLILGLPEEDEESLRQTKEFVVKTKPDFLFLGPATPFPGTKYFEDCKELKLLDRDMTRDIANSMVVTGSSARISSKYLSAQKIEEAKNDIHRAYVFSSPKILFNKFLKNLHRLNYGYLKEKFNYFLLKKNRK